MKRSSRRPRRRVRSEHRRGVLLLVVLSLLVLFLLVGTTFLIVSGQYRTAAKIVETSERTTFQPADVLERALMQLLRDTNNPNSVVRHHSLLRDLYGTDGFFGRVLVNALDADNLRDAGILGFQNLRDEAVAPRYAGVDPLEGATLLNNNGLGPTEGQIIEFFVGDVSDGSGTAADRLREHNVVGLEFDENGLPVEHELSTIDGYYEGSVLTMVSGPCAGQSVRVVDYDYLYTATATVGGTPLPSRVARFRVLAPRRGDGQPLSLTQLQTFSDFSYTTPQLGLSDLVESLERGHAFVVNGRPFNGTGVGFNPLALASGSPTQLPAKLSAMEAFVDPAGTHRYGLEVALTPNSVHFLRDNVAFFNTAVGRDPWSPPAGPYPSAAFGALATATGESLYRTFAGAGDTDESYDAPDFQNMALASQPPQPRLRGRVVVPSNATTLTPGTSVDPAAYFAAEAVAPAYVDAEGVPIPSFHRPALANFWFHRLFSSAWLTDAIPDPGLRVRAILEPFTATGTPQAGLSVPNAAQIAAIKRKFLLRPLREDHPNFDGSNLLSRYEATAAGAVRTNGLDIGNVVNAATGEITFPTWEAVGPWDVDNDGDGVPDSVWVDLGLPVQKTEDGRWYKPLVAMLVEDLDGRLNLNAHGSEEHLATEFNGESKLDASNDVGSGTFLNANLAMDSTRLATAITDSLSNGFATDLSWLRSSDQLPEGDGWGPPEVSLRAILSPDLPLAEFASVGVPPNAPPFDVGYAGNPQYDDYARLLWGRPSPVAVGRTAAAALNVSRGFGRYGSQPGDQSFGAITGLSLTAPGRSFVPQSSHNDWDDEQAVRAATTDPRTPFEFLGAPEYATTNAQSEVPLNQPSGFSSPPDWRSRYSGGLSLAGAPVAEPVSAAFLLTPANPQLTWRQDVLNTPNDSPFEIDLTAAARRLPPVSLNAIRNSYDADGDAIVDVNAAPLDDDAPFSPADLERLLRALDADAATLPDRLWNLVDAFDPAKLAAATSIRTPNAGPNLNESVLEQIREGASGAINNPAYVANSLENVVAAAQAAINRRAVTTDSWDLPVPNENWAERLALGADGLPGVPWNDTDLSGGLVPQTAGDVGDDDGDGVFDEGDEVIIGYQPGLSTDGTYDNLFRAGCDDYVVVMREDPPASPRITDYLRYRVTLQLLREGVFEFDPADPNDVVVAVAPNQSVDQIVNRIIFGDNTLPTAQAGSAAGYATFGGMLAPELLAGRRMNLNRPLGDGRDNNGNGVVDEPIEAGEPYTYDSSFPGGELVVTSYQDRNNNGALDQDVDGDSVLAIDTDGDGFPDRLDPGDVIDADGDGFLDGPNVDHLWVDADGNGLRYTGEDATRDFATLNELRPFNHTAGADASGRGAFIDANADGVFEPGETLIRDDAHLARQLLARHLYCLMLALVDENYVAPIDPNDLQAYEYTHPDLDGSVAYEIAQGLYVNRFGSEVAALTGRDSGSPIAPDGTLPPGAHVIALADPDRERDRQSLIAEARVAALRKLTRRMIAQWAINVVDFRDPDSIQTPFEYDENPWDGWNVVDSVGEIVYPLDGDLTTDETYRTLDPSSRQRFGQTRIVTAAGVSEPNPIEAGDEARYDDFIAGVDTSDDARTRLAALDRTRGVVWGAERPELLITEGLAFHDRRLTDSEINTTRPTSARPDGEDVDDGGAVIGGADDDFDQLVPPKGSAFIEVFNPWQSGEQSPAELYSSIDRAGGFTLNRGVRLSPGVRLDRLSDAAYEFDASLGIDVRSPVWRIVSIEEDPRLRNATQGQPGSGSSLEWLTDDPSDGPNADKGRFVYGGAGFGDAEPLSVWQTDRARESEAAVATTVALTANGVNDADGVAIGLGVRERGVSPPDPGFDGFDSLAVPFDARAPAFTLEISSPIDGTLNEGAATTISRLQIEKPRRYITQAVYPVTPNPAATLQGLREVPIPRARVEFTRGGSSQYDPSGFRIPSLEVTLPNPIPAAGAVSSDWIEEELVEFGARPATGAAGGGASGSQITFTLNRFATFDWFDWDNDGQRLVNGLGGPVEEVPLAPVLPGRRAVIGTTGAIYEVDNIGSIHGQDLIPTDDLTVYESKARFFVDPALNSAPQSDVLGPRRLEGRLTTLFAPEIDPTTPGQRTPLIPTVPGNPNRQSVLRSAGRFEMIPHFDPDTHQFAVRMNGLVESTTGYSTAFGNAENVSVLPAFSERASASGAPVGSIADLSGPPVVAAPIDNFSLSEPVDRYLLRILELDPGSTAEVSLERRTDFEGSANFPLLEYAEGLFVQNDNQSSFGFDEPFDTQPELTKNQTTPNYRSVHLQRLADPTLPWNPAPYDAGAPTRLNPNAPANVDYHQPSLPVNPYLSVDAMPIDLTAMNSRGDEALITSGTSTVQGPEVLHRSPRDIPAASGANIETRSPFVASSKERGRPSGVFRNLWNSTVGRLLWRQARPTTTSELVIGTDVRTAPAATLPQHRFPASTTDVPQRVSGPDPRVVGNGFDFTADMVQLGFAGPLPLAADTTAPDLTNRVFEVGWRASLGFTSPWYGRTFLGGNLRWRRAFTVANPERIDLDGDRNATDLLGKAEMSNADSSMTPNGRPTSLTPGDWDNQNNDNVVDSYEAAQSELRDQSTTPELLWPNRPFANAGELLQVPVWGSSRMLNHFSAFNWLHTQGPEFWHHTQVNPYNGEGAVFHDGKDYAGTLGTGFMFDGDFANEQDERNRDFDSNGQPDHFHRQATNEIRFRETLGHFGHLANFLQTARFPAYVQPVREFFSRATATSGSGGTSVAPSLEASQVPLGAAHFYRLLDYVHVPSRFVATDTLLNPDVFAFPTAPDDVRGELAAPFNRVDRYREPGRVNLNTIVGRRDPGEAVRHDPINGATQGESDFDDNRDVPRAPDYWSEVYDGLMHRRQDDSVIDHVGGSLLKAGHLGPAWRDVALSRRGYVQPTFDPTVNPLDESFSLATPTQNQIDYNPRRMHPDFPTFFANPFRAPGEGANVPLQSMVQTGVDATVLRAHPLSPGADGAWGRRGFDDPTVDKSGDPAGRGDVNGLRDDANEAGAVMIELGAGGDAPDLAVTERLVADVALARFDENGRRGALPDTFLEDALRPNATAVNPREVSPAQSRNNGINNAEIGRRVTPVALFSGATTEPSLDTERNATTRYQPIQRMSGMATTRSNVYAVWITVGFFEVTPAAENPSIWPRYMTDNDNDGIGDQFGSTLVAGTPDQLREEFFRVYQDGWTLGQELGFDDGTNQRHRGFYIVDRSRPVAFRPGEDANVSETVLVRRRIE